MAKDVGYIYMQEILKPWLLILTPFGKVNWYNKQVVYYTINNFGYMQINKPKIEKEI